MRLPYPLATIRGRVVAADSKTQQGQMKPFGVELTIETEPIGGRARVLVSFRDHPDVTAEQVHEFLQQNVEVVVALGARTGREGNRAFLNLQAADLPKVLSAK